MVYHQELSHRDSFCVAAPFFKEEINLTAAGNFHGFLHRDCEGTEQLQIIDFFDPSDNPASQERYPAHKHLPSKFYKNVHTLCEIISTSDFQSETRQKSEETF